tara:strand:- start:6069 stop:6986 length:918 start_codon:yes stop_codon:yes gene_type:complete
MIRRVTATEVKVTEGGSVTSMPIMEVALKSLMAKAAKGDIHAYRTVEKALTSSIARTAQDRQEAIGAMMRYPAYWKRRFREEFVSSDPFSLPLPHPDHLKLCSETGEIFCKGPLSRAQLNDLLVGIEARARLEAELKIHAVQGLCHDEEAEMMSDLHAKFVAQIPDHDPIWKLFGLVLIDRIFDHRLYYAEAPKPWDLDRPTGSFAGVNHRPVLDHSVLAVDHLRVHLAFRKFMREKVREEMDEIWIDRLKPENLIPRDIERDFIRYQYEIGNFNMDEFEFTFEEKARLADPAALREYMQWDRAA